MQTLASCTAFNPLRTAFFPFVFAFIVLVGSIVGASCAELRILSFDEELGRARSAIGQEAECRVTIEGISAGCRELKTVQGLPALIRSISIDFSPGQQKQIAFGSPQPPDDDFYNGISQQYGIPKDALIRCISTRSGPPYLGDYELSCDFNRLTIKYAKRF